MPVSAWIALSLQTNVVVVVILVVVVFFTLSSSRPRRHDAVAVVNRFNQDPTQNAHVFHQDHVARRTESESTVKLAVVHPAVSDAGVAMLTHPRAAGLMT